MQRVVFIILSIALAFTNIFPLNAFSHSSAISAPLQQEATGTLSPTVVDPTGTPTPESTSTPDILPTPTEEVTVTSTLEPTDTTLTPTIESTETVTPTATQTEEVSLTPEVTITEEIQEEEFLAFLDVKASPRFIRPGGKINLHWYLSFDPARDDKVYTLQIRTPSYVIAQEGEPFSFNADGVLESTGRLDKQNGVIKLDVFDEILEGDSTTLVIRLFRDGEKLAEKELSLALAKRISGKEGGEVSGAMDKRVKVIFPPNALPEDADVVVMDLGWEDESLTTSPSEKSWHSFKIEAYRANGEEITQFDHPITIEYCYNDLFFPSGDEENLALFYFSEETNSWVPLPSLVDTENKIVIGYSDHLTVFDIDLNYWEAASLPTMEGFQTSLFTGAATYSYPFEVPTGPGGLQPELSLSYNSQVVDAAWSHTQAEWVGMGWSLDTGYIQRNMNGTENRQEGIHSIDYDPTADDTFSIVVNGVSDTLLPIPETEGDGDTTTIDYRTTIDTFWRIRRYNLNTCAGFSYATNGSAIKDCSYWIAWDKSGNQYRFGYNGNDDGGTSYYFEWHKGTEGTAFNDWGYYRPWRWSLTAVTNTSNKTLSYSYTNSTKSTDYSSGSPSYTVDIAVYPKEIVYPHDNYRVRFEYGDRTDYKTDWEAETSNVRYQTKKLGAIVVEQYNGSAWALMRKYILDYYTNAESTIFPNITWSKGGKTLTLKSITEIGTDGTSALPSTTFTYDAMHLTEATNGYGGRVVFEYEESPWHSTGAPDSFTIKRQYYTGDGIYGACEKWGNVLGWSPIDVTEDFTACLSTYENGVHIIFPYLTLRGHTYNDVFAKDFRPGGWYTVKLNISGENAPMGPSALALWIGDRDQIPGSLSLTSLSTNYSTMQYTGFVSGDADKVSIITNCLKPGDLSRASCKVRNESLTLLPTRYRVVSKSTYASSSATEPTQSVTYQYFGAAMNNTSNSDAASQPEATRYNDPYTEFRGHEHVVATYSNGQVVTTYFYQDDVLKGQISRVTVANADGKIFSENLYTYEHEAFPLATSAAYFPRNSSGAAFTDLLGYRVFTESEVTRNYNGDVAVPAGIADDATLMWTGSRIEYHYQTAQQGGKQYGNLTQIVQSYWTGSVWKDYRLTWSEFYPRDEQTAEARHIVGLPAYTNVYSCPDNSQNGDCYNDNEPILSIDYLLSSTSYIYDSLTPTTDRTGQPTKGLLTQVRELMDIDQIDNTQRLYRDTFTAYDEWAMPTSTTTYSRYGTLTAVASTDPQTTTITTTITYDSTYHTYPEATTQITPGSTPDERTTTVTYHPILGLPETETDPNGAVTSAKYDEFGRMTKLIRPGDSELSPTLSFSYHAETYPFWTELSQKITETSTSITKNFYDGLGNLIQKQITGGTVTDDACSTDVDEEPDVCNIVVNYKYEETGNGTLSRVSDPYAVTPADGYDTTSRSEAVWTIIQSDILGRTVRTTQPDGTFTENEYTIRNFSILGTTLRVVDTVSTDAFGSQTHTYSDSRGRTVQVIAPLGPGIVYEYDELDRLTEVNQVNRNDNSIFAITTLILDMAGRKIEMTDPDMGHWTYSYDALGNLVSQCDANGEVISLEYDALNRLITKKSGPDSIALPPDGIPLPDTLSVMIHYDIGTNNIGYRTGMSDSSGSTTWNYDERGRLINETKIISDAGSFLTQWTYYSNDAVKTMTYPGGNSGQAGEIIQYTYNSQSLLESMTSSETNYVPEIVYDEARRVENLSLGGTTSDPTIQKEFTYYPWNNQGGRLNIISSALQTLTYTYDDNGNITQMVDARSAGSETLNYYYDTLNRLRAVTGAYTESLLYDSNGRIAQRAMPGESGWIFIDDFSTKSLSDWSWSSYTTVPYTLADGQVVRSAGNNNYETTGFTRSEALQEQTTIQVRFKLSTTSTNTRFFFGLPPAVNYDPIPTPTTTPCNPCDISMSSESIGKLQSDFGMVIESNVEPASWTYYNQAGLIETNGTFYFFQGATYFSTTKTPILSNVQANTWYNLTIYRGTGNTSSDLTITITQESDPTKTGTLTQTVNDVDWHFRHTIKSGTAYIDEYRESQGTLTEYSYDNTPHAVSDLTYNGQVIRQYTYDDNGNMVTRVEGADTYAFAYDEENRLTSGTKNGVTLATYVYDGNGVRVKAVENGVTTIYIGDYYEWRSDSTTTTEVKYYSANGQRIAMSTNGTLTWLLGDHLGSTTITANADGTLASGQTYTAWGTTRGGTLPTDRQYTGQISEPQLGIYFYNARYYDPYLARFISPDTLIPQPGNPLAWDRYSYVNSNPINSIDPSGHKSCDSDAESVDECKYVATNIPYPNFLRLPVDSDSIEWIQWFGATEFAYLDHLAHEANKPNWNYDGYCQGYHCGIDVGAEWGTPVYAGLYGEVTAIGTGSVTISVGDYQILYQSLDGNFQVKVGDQVNPNTVIAGVGNHEQDPNHKNTHLHLEVRYNSLDNEGEDYKNLIGNPLLFMNMVAYEQLASVSDNSPIINVRFPTSDDQDPRNQISPIHRGGPVLWADNE